MKAKVERMLEYIEQNAQDPVKGRLTTRQNRIIDILFIKSPLDPWRIILDGNAVSTTKGMTKNLLLQNLITLGVDVSLIENLLSKIVAAQAALYLKLYRESLNLVKEEQVLDSFVKNHVIQPEYKGKPKLSVLKGGKE